VIDTIVYPCFLKLSAPAQWPKGWRGFRPITVEGNESQDYAMTNELPGVRVFIHEGVITKVEADLPKLLYGHNARLLKSQEDIDLAFFRLRQVLQSIAKPMGAWNGYFPGDNPAETSCHFTRVDLVWQFDLDPSFVLLALRNAKHPEIHKRTGEWSGQTLAFPGTKIRISCYDKKAKARACVPHNVMRVEIQLSDEKISSHFGLGQGVLQTLSLQEAYKAYRDTLRQFGSDLVPDPNSKGTVADFLALMVTKLPDDDPVGTYCMMKKMSHRRSRDLRNKVGKRVPTLVEFSWSRLLPDASLPPVIEIESTKPESRITHFFSELEKWAAIYAERAA
jgi:hypothetical protein